MLIRNMQDACGVVCEEPHQKCATLEDTVCDIYTLHQVHVCASARALVHARMMCVECRYARKLVSVHVHATRAGVMCAPV